MVGVDVVIHLAARAHVIREENADPLAEFRRVNVQSTMELAQLAAEARVTRFIFVSSIGVNGNRTSGAPFRESSPAAPVEPYALSKWEAEQGLRTIERDCGLGVTIVRLPLVYGPNVKGNFLRLLRLVDSAVPLPLGAITNLRSYIGADNVCDFLLTCIHHPKAPGELFLLADGEDISTPALVRKLAASLGKPARLFPLPRLVLRTLAGMVGRRAEMDRLTDSLQVDATHARKRLDWVPPVSLSAGIDAMGRWYREQQVKGQGL